MSRVRARSPVIATVVAVVGLGLALASCGSARVLPAQHRAAPVVRMAPGRPAHVAVLVMENEEYGDVLGTHGTPYLHRLAARSGLATQMYGTTHPSLPNYLALTGGSTFHITSDCTGCTVTATSLVDQLARAGISWRAYMEDLPHACFRGAGSAAYAKKHDPFMYYTRVADRPDRCSHVVPLTRLRSDERAGALPRFIWITPNLCHDMHDCDTATGDRFLSQLVPGLLPRLGPGGILFLTWDEGSSDDGCCGLARGGHIATLVAGPGARPGARMSTPADHYSVLRTIEDVLGLPRMRGAACSCTPSMAGLLRGLR
jgi:phosphatidylinositol-3-phosphatase